MIDYDVGDVVVCVDAGPSKPCEPNIPLQAQTLYRVSDMGRGWSHGGNETIWVDLCGMAIDPARGLEASRFKKLPKADSGFIALIKTKKQPKRRLEPAG